MRNIAVILAGGIGRRLGLDIPKQFLKVAGKTVLEHTVDKFEEHENIDEICIVAHPQYIWKVEEIVSNNNWRKVKKILIGGNERYASSFSAIKSYSSDKDEINLIFHDSVRPLVSKRIITDVCEKLLTAQAIDVVVPAIDTIVKTDVSGKIISSIPNRKYLRRGQTPQAFRLSVIKEAYEIALNDPKFHATDDCGIVVNYMPTVPIEIVLGEESNIKLTNPEDIYLLDKLFQIKSTTLSEQNLKTLHNKVAVVFGGNSGIGKSLVEILRYHGTFVEVFSRSVGKVDISNFDSVKDSLDKVFSKYGRIDYVINTAAILNKEPIINLSVESIKNLVNINYLGAVYTTIASFEYIKYSKGHIIQFTSSSYTRGRANYALYSSSKSAVVNFTQAIAEEWGKFGIHINCINPQRTKTPMRLKNFGIEDENTLLKPEEVALITAKTLIENITGQVIDVKI